jgi:hypothetical protein
LLVRREPPPKLWLWQAEAYREIGVEHIRSAPRRVIFPKSIYAQVQSFSQDKDYDFCFIGTFRIDELTESRRQWLPEFALKHFTERSFLQFTDSKTKENYHPLGAFDFTLRREGFVPKEEPLDKRGFVDEFYYRTMCRSQFSLCPAGDESWSMRFYEAMMCRSIPVLQKWHHHRTLGEFLRGYKYYVIGDKLEFRPEWAEHNYSLFLKHHTLH